MEFYNARTGSGPRQRYAVAKCVGLTWRAGDSMPFVRRVVVSVWLLLFALVSNAQRGPSGSITGHVRDTQTGKGLAFATVQVLNASDSTLVNGALTDDNGWFTVQPVPMGQYTLRIGYVGYADVTRRNVVLTPERSDVDAGNIELQSSVTLDEVVVTESRGNVTLAPDRKIYNVGETAQPGQNANEVLQSLPSISQDSDGALQLRGNTNVTIMIDGRPVNALGQSANVLEQINAEAIERVEVITNPSAKFDPEGVAGIVNIVLKKNKQRGVNGSVGGTYGYDDHKSTGTFNMNARAAKVNANIGASARYFPVDVTGKMLRTYTNDSSYTLRQSTKTLNTPVSGTLRGGVDWFINPRNTLSLSALGGMSRMEQREEVTFDFSDAQNNPVYRYNINSTANNNGRNSDLSLLYKKTFVRKGTELDILLSHLTNDDERDTRSTPLLFDSLPPLFVAATPYRQTLHQRSRIVTGQADYLTEFNDAWKFETGFKQTVRIINNSFAFNRLNPGNEPLHDSTAFSSALRYHDFIFAGYATLARTINKTSLKAGVRGEEAQRFFSLEGEADEYRHRRFDVFPSVFVLQRLPQQQEATLSYSRRINRPSVHTLNPFPDFNDPYSRMQGNPYIEPEFIHAVEAGYQKYFDKSVFNTTLYYRLTTNEISRVRTTNGLVSEIRMVNLKQGFETGMELTYKMDFFRWWRHTLSGNVYYDEVDGSNFEVAGKRGAVTFDAKWHSLFLFGKTTGLQANASYRSRRVAPQGEILPMYWLDLTLRQDLLKQKATATLGLSDVFDTRRFRIETDAGGLVQNWERKRESRVLTLGFTYKFGRQIGQQPRKRGPERSDEFGGGGGDF